VTSVQENLRGDVFGGTTDSVGSLLDDFSKAIVDELEISICANHDVLRLKISVHDVLGMQVLENRSDLSAIESRESHNDFKQVRIKRYLLSLFGVEVTNSSVVGEQIATWEKFSSKVDVSVVLEETIVAESKRMVNSLKDELLILNVINVLAVDNLSLLHGLDGVLLVRLAFQPADLDISESTFS